MIPIVENVIDRVDDGNPQIRDAEALEGALIHRVGIDDQTGIILGFDAVAICDHFTGHNRAYPEVAQATGGNLAYSIMIGGDRGPDPELDGKIWQCLPLDEIGHHARRFGSAPYLGIACIGDFRKGIGRAISGRQRASLIDFLVLICAAYGWDPYRAIKGHGEVAGTHDGSKSPGEPAACPGDLINMNILRDDIAIMSKENPRRILHDRGFVFSK
jgi:hypothetical protein